MTDKERKERLIDGFLELVKIDSPTFKEDKMVEALKPKLEKLGFDVSEDNAGSLIGGTANNLFGFLAATSKASNMPTLTFTAHMDCVNPCIGVKPQRKDGIIRSAGDTVLGADDKAGIMAFLEAIARLQEDKIPHCNIQVIFTVSEEVGLNGSKNIAKEKIKGNFAYVLDSSTKPGVIINKAPGMNTIKAVIKGKKSHAGLAPEKGINAIMVLSLALAKIHALNLHGRLSEESTSNVGTIKGGEATNIVPDYAEILYEVRSISNEKLKNITQEIVDVFEKTAKEHAAQAVVEVTNNCASYHVAEDSQVIVLAKEAAKTINLPVTVQATGGGSDASTFNAAGLISVPLGTGMTSAHTVNEYISEDDIETLTQFVVAIVKVASK